MTWPPGQRQRPPQVSWTLQIQYKPGGWWSDHTSNLFTPAEANALLGERRAANPKCRYRLVRVTTTWMVETGPPK